MGTVRQGNRFYVRVTKYSAGRALLWSQDIGPAIGVSLPVDLQTSGLAVDATGITLVGTTTGSFGGRAGDPQRINGDGWMAKLDPDGAVLWHGQTSTFDSDSFDQVVTDSSGAIFVRGTFLRGLQGGNAFVRRYREGFVQVWGHDVPFDRPLIDAGGLAVSPLNEVYAVLAGTSSGLVHDPQFVKLDFDGQPAWTTHLAANGIELPYDVKLIDSTREVLVLGTHVTGPVTASGVRLAKLDSTGAIMAMRAIDTPQMTRAYSMAITGADLYLAGDTRGDFGAMNAGSLDAWVARLDYSATRCWQ